MLKCPDLDCKEWQITVYGNDFCGEIVVWNKIIIQSSIICSSILSLEVVVYLSTVEIVTKVIKSYNLHWMLALKSKSELTDSHSFNSKEGRSNFSPRTTCYALMTATVLFQDSFMKL